MLRHTTTAMLLFLAQATISPAQEKAPVEEGLEAAKKALAEVNDRELLRAALGDVVWKEMGRVDGATFTRSLIYLGNSGTVVRLGYRESLDKAARQAFSEDFTHDLANGKVFAFRDEVLISVELVDGQGLKFRRSKPKHDALRWHGTRSHAKQEAEADLAEARALRAKINALAVVRVDAYIRTHPETTRAVQHQMMCGVPSPGLTIEHLKVMFGIEISPTPTGTGDETVRCKDGPVEHLIKLRDGVVVSTELDLDR